MDARALEASLTRAAPTLVVAPNWVGDTVMALPVLAALARSGRRLAVLAKPHLAPLVALSGLAERIVERASSDRTTVAALAEIGAPEAVILPNSFRAAWLVRRAGIARRWGYRGGWRRGLLAPALVARRRGHQLADYDDLLAAMGVDPPQREPRLAIPPPLERRAGETLTAALGGTAEQLVGIFPGAEFGPAKRWPAERFRAVAGALARRAPAPRVVVIAGPKETELARQATPQGVPLVGPRLDLAQLAALLARLDLLITNDSGPMHLAAAVGTPTIALFGPTDPGRTAPAGDRHRILYTGRWCSPCFRRRCPLGHHRCLRDIGVERVLDAAAGALQELPVPSPSS